MGRPAQLKQWPAYPDESPRQRKSIGVWPSHRSKGESSVRVLDSARQQRAKFIQPSSHFGVCIDFYGMCLGLREVATVFELCLDHFGFGPRKRTHDPFAL